MKVRGSIDVRRVLATAVAALGVLLGGVLFSAAPALAAPEYEFQKSFGSFSGPVGLAVDNSAAGTDKSDVYVVNQGLSPNGKVEEFSASGSKLSGEAEAGEIPNQLTVDDYSAGGDEGNVYVASFHGNAVYGFGPGLTSGAVVSKETLPNPTGVAVDDKGAFFVSMHETDEVREYNSKWEPINAKEEVVAPKANNVVPTGAGGTAQTLAVSANGEHIYLATAEGEGGVYVYKLESGSYVAKGTLGSSGATGATGVTVVASGNIFVDQGTEVVEYEPSGTEVTKFGSGHIGEGYGVGVNEASGDVYVADHSGSSNTVQVFEPKATRPKFKLKVEKEGTGASEGEVTSVPAGIECGTTCEAEFEEGETVTLKATGATLAKWTGCTAKPGKSEECEVTIAGETTVKAEMTSFVEFPLKVEVTGKGEVNGGEVTKKGIKNCAETGGMCTENAKETETVELTAKEAPGWKFAKWSLPVGVICENGSLTTTPCKFKMPKEKVTVTAEFVETHAFSLNVVTTGQGTVTGPGGIDCTPETSGTCSASLEGEATLKAEPESGYVFAGWLGCKHTGVKECKVDMTEAREVTAVFLKEGIQGVNGKEGKEGPAGPEGFEGIPGEQGLTGVPGLNGHNGATGSNGAAGATGPQGPAGPAGPAGPPGKVQLVTCVKRGGKQHCTSKLVSGGTIKLTASAARATLSRHGAVYATGAAFTGARGRLSLRLTALRGLRAGRYTLTLISGSGAHERIRTEAFTLS